MTPGPYRPGKNAVSASRLNETDMLARRRIQWGEGFEVSDTGTVMTVNLRQKGGGGGESEPAQKAIWQVVVRDIRDDNDHFIMVQDVGRDDADPWTGGMKPIGVAYKISIWAHGKARDFRALLTRETTLTRATSIVSAVRSLGQPWVVQYLRFDLIQPRARIRYTDCVSAFVERP